MATYPAESDVLQGVQYGPNDTDYTGNVALPASADVRAAVEFGPNSIYAGTLEIPLPPDVRYNVSYGDPNNYDYGELVLPEPNAVAIDALYDALASIAGRLCAPHEDDVRAATGYGDATTIQIDDDPALLTPTTPQNGHAAWNNAISGASLYFNSGYGTYVLEVPGSTWSHSGNGIGPLGTYGDNDHTLRPVSAGTTGTLALPSPGEVLSTASYGADGTEFNGTLVLPGTDTVLAGVSYGPDSGSTGEVILPDEADVREAVTFGAGEQYTGALVVGAGNPGAMLRLTT